MMAHERSAENISTKIDVLSFLGIGNATSKPVVGGAKCDDWFSGVEVCGDFLQLAFWKSE